MHTEKILRRKVAVSIAGRDTGQSDAATRLGADDRRIRLYLQLRVSLLG